MVSSDKKKERPNVYKSKKITVDDVSSAYVAEITMK